MTETHGREGTLVTTEWAEKHLSDPHVRFVEVDVDKEAYGQGHLPGAVGWNWETQLSDRVRRDLVPKEALEQLLSTSGITNETTVVLYGDNNNWFAAWAYWQLEIYGHKHLRILDGGRKKWVAESRPLTQEEPSYPTATYKAHTPDYKIRAFLADVSRLTERPDSSFVDVRSNDEYTGKILAPPGLPETAQRGGHIPGAVNIPWGQNVREDGTFKSQEELTQLYASKGVTPDKQVVAYCRIGERSSLTWFVLKELLGYQNVKNYDGSWTEWGNLVGAPVERPGA